MLARSHNSCRNIASPVYSCHHSTRAQFSSMNRYPQSADSLCTIRRRACAVPCRSQLAHQLTLQLGHPQVHVLEAAVELLLLAGLGELGALAARGSLQPTPQLLDLRQTLGDPLCGQPTAGSAPIYQIY